MITRSHEQIFQLESQPPALKKNLTLNQKFLVFETAVSKVNGHYLTMAVVRLAADPSNSREFFFCQNDVSLNFDEDPLCLENQTLFEKKKLKSNTTIDQIGSQWKTSVHQSKPEWVKVYSWWAVSTEICLVGNAHEHQW